MLKDFKIAILAGGLATRLYPTTKKVPKSLIEINGQPFIKHQLELLKNKGINNVVLCLGNLGEEVEEYLIYNKLFGMNIEFSYDGEKLLGTGGAIYNSFDKLSNPFGILYGDSYLNIEYKEILNYFIKCNCESLMTVLRNNNKWDKSNAKYGEGKVIEYNKDNYQQYEYIDYGFSILKKECFGEYKSDSVFDLKEVFRNLVNTDKMYGYEVYERFYEIGSFEGISEMEDYLKNK